MTCRVATGGALRLDYGPLVTPPPRGVILPWKLLSCQLGPAPVTSQGAWPKVATGPPAEGVGHPNPL